MKNMMQLVGQINWFEVRDMLHNAGYIMAAQRAHYQAMPQLPEVSSMLGHTSLRDVFGTVQRDGSNELLLDYIRRARSRDITTTP